MNWALSKLPAILGLMVFNAFSTQSWKQRAPPGKNEGWGQG